MTKAAAGLACRIGRLLGDLDLALHENRTAYEGHTGVVVNASNPVLSSIYVPGGLARCAEAFPDLIVSVQDQPQCAVLTHVEQGEVDFCAVSDGEPLATDKLHAQALFPTPLGALLPHEHPLARRTTLAWSALSDVPLLTLNSDIGSHSVVERALRTHCVRGRPIQKLGHVAAVLPMIELGLGVGVLPVDAQLPAPSERLVSLRLLPAVMLTTMLVRRRNRSLSPNAAAVWAQSGDAGAAAAHSVDELLASANGRVSVT